MVKKGRYLHSIPVTGQVAFAGSAADIIADERIRVACQVGWNGRESN